MCKYLWVYLWYLCARASVRVCLCGNYLCHLLSCKWLNKAIFILPHSVSQWIFFFANWIVCKQIISFGSELWILACSIILFLFIKLTCSSQCVRVCYVLQCHKIRMRHDISLLPTQTLGSIFFFIRSFGSNRKLFFRLLDFLYRKFQKENDIHSLYLHR